MTSRRPPAHEPATPPSALALALAVTIRHDGSGGVADDLDTPDRVPGWLARVADDLPGAARRAAERLGEDAATLHTELIALRQGIRTLFALAVAPDPPSPADAHRLLDPAEAVDRVNRAAARAPGHGTLRTTADGWRREHGTDADDRDVLSAVFAESAVGLLTGPDRTRLRACRAPRCVRYFLPANRKQEWCGVSCGNRARAARHYRRHRTEPATD